jgi:putative transposase
LNLTRDERVALVERAETILPLVCQAELLSLSRSSLYYQARAPRSEEVAIKHRLDVLYTEQPFLGSRKIVALLQKEGISVSRHTVRHYRQEMGMETLYPKPRLSAPSNSPEHRVFPYLLRGLTIERPNQVWGVDITYVRLIGNWMYLVAFLDWYSRYVVAWELSDNLELPFVLSCAESALSRQVPEIVNSDQGSHFTSERFTRRFLDKGVRVSMDGRGRYVDNIFTERLWRSVKYEEVYLSEYESPRDARRGLTRYLSFYNEERPHQALGYRTPAQVYRAGPKVGAKVS